MKIYHIIPRKLYQSARTHELTTLQKYDLMNKYKFDIIVNLWHTADEEMAELTKLYIHEYYPDGKTPIYDKLGKLADTLFLKISAGSKVLTHCWGGRNRSGLLNAMLVMRLWGYSGEQALEHVITSRPGSLSNKHFAQWLMEQRGAMDAQKESAQEAKENSS